MDPNVSIERCIAARRQQTIQGDFGLVDGVTIDEYEADAGKRGGKSRGAVIHPLQHSKVNRFSTLSDIDDGHVGAELR